MFRRPTWFLLLAIGSAAAVAAFAQQQIITTIAGTTFTFPPSPLPALSAPLGRVQGVAVDSKGNIYAADPQNSIVVRISPSGVMTVVAGSGIAGSSGDGGPATAASLNFPSGVAVDSAGNLYIVDAGNNRIREVSGGTITTVAGNGSLGFSGDGGLATSASLGVGIGLISGGVAVDSAGNLYIADTGNNRIRKVSGGTITTVAGNGSPGFSGDGGPATSAELNGPYGVAVDSAGSLYIADTFNSRIRKVSGGIIMTVAGGGVFLGDGGPATGAGLNYPDGVAVDSAGNLYIADTAEHRIRKVSSGTISTIAGNGALGYSGDGGPATSASLYFPSGVAVDSTGNLYVTDTDNDRIRIVAAGKITTAAGNGSFQFSGDGGPATSASLDLPNGLAIGPAGSLYIADTDNKRIRKVSGGTITTVAGNGSFQFSGDGGPAVSASFDPYAAAVDLAGNLYIADTGNNRIRKVSGGTITTVAGNGNSGFSGDGGLATSASLTSPTGVAVDSAGNLYIADGSGRVRKVSGGTITTVAGNGTYGYSGDGGPATSASLAFDGIPGVAVDSAGNLYIADTGNNRIRKVSAGTITTVAGGGPPGFAGDGGPATSASLSSPQGLAVDSAGNLYIADFYNERIRKVSGGIITTIAGSGIQGFSGDGGAAANASFKYPMGVAVDTAGNVYVADTQNNRIREVFSGAASFQATPVSLSFSTSASGNAPGPQTINLVSAVAGLAFTASTNATWLSVNLSSGSMPSVLQVSVDPTGLPANAYQGIVTITAPNASPSTQTVTVSFTISGGTPPSLSVSSQSLPFSLAQGASPGTAQFSISNLGSGSARYAASAATTSGGSWLQISSSSGSTSGSVTAAAPVSLNVTATPGTLTPGTYNGTITVTGPDTGQTLIVTAILSITTAPPKILLSQLGFTFTAVAQGGTVLPQNLGILNSGAGTLSYSVQATTQSGGSGWLSVSPNSGTVTQPLLEVSDIGVVVNANQVPPPGTYYGQITVTANGASNSPQSALVVLTVLPAGSNPGPDVRPTGLVFIGAVGAESPGSQNVTVANVTANPTTFGTSVAYVTGAGWINSQPTNFTVPPEAPEPIVVQPNLSTLTSGQYRAALTAAFDDGSIRNVSILTVVAPAGTPVGNAAMERDRPLDAQATSACTATKLLPQFTAIGLNSNLTVGYPAFVAAIVVDDCGIPTNSGSVILSFNNGDPPLSLISNQGGEWTNSWQPNYSTGSVTLTLTATLANLTGTATASPGAVQQGSQNPPMLSGTPLGAATKSAGSFAPGDLMLLQGTGLADGKATSGSTPTNQLAGASLLVGAQEASLLYADPSQVIALIPSNVPLNSTPQLVVSRDAGYIIVPAVNISTTHPAILTTDASGQGQGVIYKANGAAATTLASATNPVNPGDNIIIFCTGLGATNASGIASNTPTLTIGGATAPFTYAGLALASSYPPSGAPMLLGVVSASLGGLYEITATVPAGLAGGPASVVISSAGQTSQSGVTMTIAGAQTATPTITSIDTAGGFPTIAQNGWIEIRGSNLAPASVGTGVVWSSAPSFAAGLLPTQLSGVSATVDGKSAFVYFVSPAQINVLTPLDSTTGPVQVVVNNNSVASAAFTATEKAVAPSFLLFGASQYVVATHANYSLAGPTSLSSPGYPFTPVAPGETVIFYGVGFGLPSTPLVNGAALQSGVLPVLPTITIGGTQATVSSANVISPGLYQFNVVIPPTAANGDNTVICTYGGLSTPAGDLITVLN